MVDIEKPAAPAPSVLYRIGREPTEVGSLPRGRNPSRARSWKGREGPRWRLDPDSERRTTHCPAAGPGPLASQSGTAAGDRARAGAHAHVAALVPAHSLLLLPPGRGQRSKRDAAFQSTKRTYAPGAPRRLFDY
jgi:hypothetical protein